MQARINSSRLPGKVLLPIGGLPVVVLAAKRAANKGRQVIVATSIEKSDDVLAHTLRQHSISCFRGSLENTLSRFVDALSVYDEKTIVFRLTSDNVIPDGKLLDEIESDFRERELEYLCCNGINSGLPYGMSVEVTRLKHLREAHQVSQSLFDTEHVTPYIIRKFGSQYFEKYFDKKMGHYRCTIDCLDDYLTVSRLFENKADPVGVGALELIDGLKGADLQPQVSKPATKLILGTAQLGLSYGIANANGQPDREVSCRLIKTAIANGVPCLDTARAYGNSEVVIGHALSGGWQKRAQVITKLAPLNDCPADAPASVVNAFVDASLFQSMNALGVQRIDTLLLHRASHLYAWHGNVWRRLLEHHKEERIGALGVSVQKPEELAEALVNSAITHIQVPFNLLDWRWDGMASIVQAVRATRKLTIHVRSVFLQGLLNSRNIEHWKRANVVEPKLVWGWLDAMRESLDRASTADLCIGYAAGLTWVDGLVIGVETMAQLSENLALLERLPLRTSEIRTICETRPKLDECSLNPVFWSLS